VLSLYPDFASHIREAAGCAPLIVTGPELEGMRRQLNRIAATAPDRVAIRKRWSGDGQLVRRRSR
jgi:hypothetical protein